MLFVTHERALLFRSLSPKKGSKQGIMHYDGEPEQQNIVYSSCRYLKITRIALRRVGTAKEPKMCWMLRGVVGILRKTDKDAMAMR